MDFKLLVYTINLLCSLFVHQVVSEEDEESSDFVLYDFAISKFDYYLSIKSSADRQQTKQWKNSDVCTHYAGESHVVYGSCRTELDEKDICLLYLVKNQSSPVVHGPVVIDSKLVDIDIKYDPNNLKLSDYSRPDDFDSENEFAPCAIAYARCALLKAVYQSLSYFDIISAMPKFPVLHTYLQLEPEIAALFPKIEKNDYFSLNIVRDDHCETMQTECLIGSHIISNYEVLSKDANETKNNKN